MAGNHELTGATHRLWHQYSVITETESQIWQFTGSIEITGRLSDSITRIDPLHLAGATSTMGCLVDDRWLCAPRHDPLLFFSFEINKLSGVIPNNVHIQYSKQRITNLFLVVI